MIQSKIIEFALGFYYANPGVFVGSIITSIILKLGFEKIEIQYLEEELEKVTKYLSKIILKLDSKYKNCCENI